MQATSVRLQQAIWSAFRAARPVSSSLARSCPAPVSKTKRCTTSELRPAERCRPTPLSQIRLYSDGKGSDLQHKIEDARSRIDKSLEDKAETVINLPGPGDDIKKKQDETIIHTLPEASSIVYDPDTPGETAAKASASASPADSHRPSAASGTSSESHDGPSAPASSSSSAESSSPLPSQLAARYSHLRNRVSNFMDDFQTHIFTASKRLNDLTGYTSIETLKRSIEEQERAVRQARQHVKDTRDQYQAAVSNRATTQREVNDLLHRKHAWTPQDLERFTSLYRSDHANEQAEQQAHANLAGAEAAYEEASTKLSKSILGRYHEEQVWSDKIRQMSTWGTWGLMGLNVLLFIVFQILVEPWRRRRLVKGFEEKVQEALREQSAEQELRTIFHIDKVREAAGVASVADAASAEVVVPSDETRPAEAVLLEIMEPVTGDTTQSVKIEEAAEMLTAAEVVAEAASVPSDSSTLPLESTADLAQPVAADSSALRELSAAQYKDIPVVLGKRTRHYIDAWAAKIGSLFDETSRVVISQRDLTGKFLEGAFVGAVGVACFFWVAGVSTVRGR